MATLIRGLEISQEPKLLSVQRECSRLTETSIGDQTSFALKNDHKQAVAIPAMLEPNPVEEIYQSLPLIPLFERRKGGGGLIAQSPQIDQEVLEEARAKAAEEGRSEGYKQGIEQAKSESHAKLNALQKLMHSVSNVLDGQILESEDMIVAVAFESTCKILGNRLLENEGVKAVVREVINRAKDREQLIVRVSRADYQMLEREKLDFLSTDEVGRVELVQDDRVTLGGCLVETSGGSLDGRLETQIQLLREILLGARKSRSEAGI